MTTLTLNTNLNGIELGFDNIPTQAIRNSLKELGFRWHNVKKVWYAKQTDERLNFAKSLADGELQEVTEPKTTKSFDFDIKVGDLFSCSWGYEQTNVDFFQVIALVGSKSVRVRQVAPKMVNQEAVSGMSADRTYQVTNEILPPISSIFIKDDEKGDLKRVKSYATDGKSNPFFEIGKGGYLCHKYNGEALYESWYY